MRPRHRGRAVCSIFLLAGSDQALRRFGPRSEQPLRIALCTLCVFAALHWTQSRRHVIYRERPSLDHLLARRHLPGRKPHPHQCQHLQSARGSAPSRRQPGRPTLRIAPDFPGYWVEAKQANPLVIDWPQKIELTNPKLRKRVYDQVRAERGKLVFIVKKFLAADFSKGKKRGMGDGGGLYPIVGLVKHTYRKVGESESFESTSNTIHLARASVSLTHRSHGDQH